MTDNWDLVEDSLADLVATARVQTTGAPVEVDGQLHDGRHWYFRARWDQVGLGIGDTEDEAMDHRNMTHLDRADASWLSAEDTLHWIRLLFEVTP